MFDMFLEFEMLNQLYISKHNIQYNLGTYHKKKNTGDCGPAGDAARSYPGAALRLELLWKSLEDPWSTLGSVATGRRRCAAAERPRAGPRARVF